MKHRLWLFTLVLAMVGMAAAQPDPLREWGNTYGGQSNDFASEIVTTEDGGFFIGGTTESFGDQRQFILIRTDAAGVPIWQRTYGGSGEEEMGGIALAANGGCLLVGVTTSFGAGNGDVWAVRVDAAGDTLWTRTYGSFGTDIANAITTLSGGGFLIAGLSNSFGNSYDAYAVWIDESGDTIRTLTYEYGMAERFLDVTPTLDGGFLFAGSSGPEGGYQNKDFFAVKTDAAGTVIWLDKWENLGEEEANGVVETSDGSFILAGYTFPFTAHADYYLMKIGSDGDSLWTRIFDAGGDDRLNDIARSIDGNYVACGIARAPDDDVSLIKIDDSGDSLWSVTIDQGNNDEWGFAIVPSECGFAVAGWTGSANAGIDMLLLKTGADVLEELD